MTRFLPTLRRLVAMVAVCAGLTGMLAPAAQARIFVGLGIPLFGPPAYYYPPPAYYPPPPVYYAPPPVTYAPPPVTYAPPPYSPGPATAQGGQMCYAGPYTCPMDRPVASGGGCYCMGNGGQRVPGRTN
jgi:hypothetical protein